MKLHSMVIDRFRAIKHRDITFEDRLGRVRPVTVLAGPNGCGKTSVLFAIIQALRYVMRYRTTEVPLPDDWDVHRVFRGPDILSRKRTHASALLHLEFPETEVLAIRQVLGDVSVRVDEEERPAALQRLDALQLNQGKVTVEWRYPAFNRDDSRRPPNFLHACDPREALELFLGRSRAISGYKQRLLSDPSLLNNIGGIHLFPQDRNLQERVVGNRNAFGVAGTTSEDAEEADDERRPVGPLPIWDILDYLSSYAQAREEKLPDEQNWQKRIQDLFNSICAPKRYLGFQFYRDDPKGRPFFEDGDSMYPLEMAASGEQVILEYITRLTYPSPLHHSLILIDEPELHLHPAWITQLYRALPQIGDDNQFIITTHSPEFRTLAAQDGALVDMGELVPAP